MFLSLEYMYIPLYMTIYIELNRFLIAPLIYIPISWVFFSFFLLHSYTKPLYDNFFIPLRQNRGEITTSLSHALMNKNEKIIWEVFKDFYFREIFELSIHELSFCDMLHQWVILSITWLVMSCSIQGVVFLWGFWYGIPLILAYIILVNHLPFIKNLLSVYF